MIITAVYYNKMTEETYELGGVNDIQHAWNMAQFVCNRTGWNYNMFHEDVKVSVK